MELRELHTVQEMLPNYVMIKQLTASLSETDHAAWLDRMVPYNYAQVVAKEDGKTIGLSGYWIGHKFYCGKYLEIDNFIVDPAHRNKGVGERLIAFLEEVARREGCALVMLDAYVENFMAHKFYHRHGFHARGFHYLKHL